VTPEHSLPGLPFDLRIELLNASETQQTVRNLASLIVRDARGNEFVAACGPGRLCALPQFNSTQFTLEPHEMRVASLLDWPIPTSATWLDDARLHVPGVYELQLRFSGTDAPTTDVARLVIDEPTGADADVWHALRQVSMNASLDVLRKTTRSVLQKVALKQPSSMYVPYLRIAQLQPKNPESAADFLRDHPDSPFGDWLRLPIAQLHLDNAQAALYIRSRPDRPTAAREIALARSQYEALAKSAIPYVADRAKTVLAFIAGRDDLSGLNAEAKKP
jgi:hypothetical protein